jgi:hypothetical protein
MLKTARTPREAIPADWGNVYVGFGAEPYESMKLAQ